MTWADLFARGAAADVDLAAVRAALAERRDPSIGDDAGERS